MHNSVFFFFQLLRVISAGQSGKIWPSMSLKRKHAPHMSSFWMLTGQWVLLLLLDADRTRDWRTLGNEANQPEDRAICQQFNHVPIYKHVHSIRDQII